MVTKSLFVRGICWAALLLPPLYLPMALCCAVDWCYEERPERLLEELEIVHYWDMRLADSMAVIYNHLFQGGLINMPSARMSDDGEVGFGYSWVPPYHNWNVRSQLLDRLEVTLNYRVFSGVEDPVLSKYGYGYYSDKGANVKFSLLLPEDSGYELPGVAVGVDDFLGTRSFTSRYIVATKVFLDSDCEATLGWGEWRIKGLFGGFSWMPFRKWRGSHLSGLSLLFEYDATPYCSEKWEPHPEGRVKKNPLNFGVKYRLADAFDFSMSFVRGEKLAFSASTHYNFGETKGFVPKVGNPLPYRSPENSEPLGLYRPVSLMMHELIYAFRDQGLDILEGAISYDNATGRTLRISIYNDCFRYESEVREQINYLLAFLVPIDIDSVTVVILSEGFPIQELRYQMPFVRRFGAGLMGPYELQVLTPLCEVVESEKYESTTLYKKGRRAFNVKFLPDLHSYFGSSKGKYKYTFGMTTGVSGFLYGDLYYSAKVGLLLFSDVAHANGIDRLNPSQIINVRSDLPKYLRKRGLTFSELYLRKVWNLGKGWYHKWAVGYFERAYGGIATELLWYPVNGRLALSFQAALLRKRTLTGLGFSDSVRKLDGFCESYRGFLGLQWFGKLYYDCREMNVELSVAAGEFLARDFGVRYELSRYFSSGMRLSFWYTMTNGKDYINGERYYDKGVMLSMPLDIFYTCSSRQRWRYGMSAWLRDVGVSIYTGEELYTLINDQRQR